jgi:hypothetical protein
LIRSEETLHFTLTPKSVREMDVRCEQIDFKVSCISY